MWSHHSFLFPIRFTGRKTIWSVKRSHHYGIFMGCHHGTGISYHTKLILGLCNINEWWRWQRSHILARLDEISCVTWFIYRSHRREEHGSNSLTAVTYSSQSNSKLYVQRNNYVPNPPIELAQCLNKANRINSAGPFRIAGPPSHSTATTKVSSWWVLLSVMLPTLCFFCLNRMI